MAKVRFKKKVNVLRVVGKLFGTLLGLWVGGTLMSNLGTVMLNTCSAFYGGLTLIGWTINSSNCVTAVTGSSTGILSVIGLIGIASIVMEFVYFKL